MKKSTKKQTRGGARPGAGRKEAADPLVRFWVRVRASRLKELGGEDSVKASFYAMIEGNGVPLPKDFINPKKIMVLKKDGTTVPIIKKEPPTPVKPPIKPANVASPAVNSFLANRRKNKLGIK